MIVGYNIGKPIFFEPMISKALLMQKLGRKRLTLLLQDRLDSIPPALAAWRLELSPDGGELTYTYDTPAQRTGITALLGAVGAAGVRFRDLRTSQSTLEEIFVGLVSERQ